MAITGIDHTCYTVADLDASVAFWTTELGFKEVSRRAYRSAELGRMAGIPGADTVIVFIAGHGQQIEFVQYLAPRGRKGGAALNDDHASHFAFTCADIRGTVSRLVAAGATMTGTIELLPDDPADLCWCAYLSDPNGIVFELIEPARRP